MGSRAVGWSRIHLVGYVVLRSRMFRLVNVYLTKCMSPASNGTAPSSSHARTLAPYELSAAWMLARTSSGANNLPVVPFSSSGGGALVRKSQFW